MEAKSNHLPYPLHLRCDLGEHKLKDLKNKINLYFGNRAKSGGGECEIQDTDCRQGYILIHFKDKEARERVLQRKHHQVPVKDSTLQVTAFLPDEEMGSGYSEEKRAHESSVDTGHQQENHQNQDARMRPLKEDSSLGGEDHKSLQDDFTNLREWGRSGTVKALDMFSSGPRSLTENEPRSLPYSDRLREGAKRRSLTRHVSIEEPVVNPPEIFLKVTAKLRTQLFNKDLQKEIKARITSLVITDDGDFVEVEGTFEDIRRVHQYLQKKQESNAEKPSDAPSSDKAEAAYSANSQAHQVCCPTALYEYIMEIYRTEINGMERKYRVKIDHRSLADGNTEVRFIPMVPESSAKNAEESFTDKVQKVMGDWSQENVDPSVIPLAFSDIKQRLKDSWRKILVIQEGNTGIILRGPKDELSQAMNVLKKDDFKPARPRRPVTILSSDIKTEIPVDAKHMDILKKLKSRDISEIEQKYNVKMNECRKNGHILVSFRAINVTPDLSPHASHSFTTLLQKTFFNIKRKEIGVKPEFQEERVSILQEDLMMRGVDIVMEYSNGSVLLIGHPLHVALTEEKLIGSQHPDRGKAAAFSEEPMDTSDSPANTKKAEEADTCPICQCEIEDKVLLEKCKHAYCKGCLKELMAHKPMCAICGIAYGTIKGDQPDGTMTERTSRSSLPGYLGCGTIEIYYDIPGGTQKENHPHPGKYFYGTSRTAYLPDNTEGRDILRLLKKAFDQRLVFTVGESRTTGASDTVTWNDIHHKTNTHGGPASFGYPDPDYLKRVRDELKAKGIE